MNLNSIPAFDDNYIWVLNDEAGRCLIVDPGDAEPVLNAISANNWQPEAIFLTHHHHDHVGGVKELVEKFPQIVVYGPQETQDKGTTQVVKDGETAFVLGHEFSVIATPGHTLGHICYFSKPYLFCGDTLFSGGCGRLFEGTPSQMYQSLRKLSALPDDTLVCCAQITLPVILKNERQINVFLRTEDIDLINVINEETLLQQPEERFAWLRSKKDRF